jgi:zinc protease
MKKILLALVAVAWIASAHAGPKIEHWVAPSGARVYFVESHALPILDVAVDFAAGAAYQPAAKAGLAGLTRSLLDTGAGKLDEEQISARQVDIGARLGGSTDDDRAGLTLRTLSSQTERDASLDLLRTLLTAPSFPEAPLAREKSRSIAAIREADTRPDSIAGKKFAAAIYPNHPYGVHASAESVERITRADLVAFHRDYYAAKRAVVSIIGDVTRQEAEAIAQKLTDSLPAGKPGEELPPVTKPVRAMVKIDHPASQAHIHIGAPAISRTDPDYYALLLGNYTLGGGGFVSRLMQEVREKRGYAYSVYSYFAPKKLEGPFEIGLQTKRAQASDAIKVVESVLGDFLAKGPSAKELAAAKKNLVDGLALRIDSNAKILGYLALIGFYNLPLTYLDDFPAKINMVTTDDVKAAFARHVKPENLVTVIVAGD